MFYKCVIRSYMCVINVLFISVLSVCYISRYTCFISVL